jgi:ankyrin repeat protein
VCGQVATTLIELGVNVNEQQPATGQLSAKLSALHVAAQKGNLEMVRLLLAKGADRNLIDKHNNTPLILAEKKKHTEIIALLRTDVLAA